MKSLHPKADMLLLLYLRIEMRTIKYFDNGTTAVLSEAWTTLPETSSQPLLATLAHSRNLAHASLETAVQGQMFMKSAKSSDANDQPQEYFPYL